MRINLENTQSPPGHGNQLKVPRGCRADDIRTHIETGLLAPTMEEISLSLSLSLWKHNDVSPTRWHVRCHGDGTDGDGEDVSGQC